MNQLKEKWVNEVVPALMEKNDYSNRMAVPKIEKIVVNIGVGDANMNSKYLDASLRELELITGAKPVVTKAKKSIAGFKLRAGAPIGCKVTLRGENMYVFLDKLINIIIPRVRDFRGLSPKSFDGRGNYTFGLSEQYIFPEIIYDDVVKARGMDIIIVTTAKTNDEAHDLLKEIGLPFKRQS
jgi:large subunit ribosomal protein L5